jgi:DNA-binding NarL/FixJ family response regulator
MYERCRGLLEAGRGNVEAARQWAGRAVEKAVTTGVRWDWLEATRALGIAALLAKDLDQATARLSSVWEHTLREGVLDPGAFPAGPDLVEALTESESYDQAQAVLDVLAERAVEGLANKEIARTLVVTVNTVEFHLRNTYAKLGIRSRVQLAAAMQGTDEVAEG